jgi:hypothetical protein
MTKIIERIHNIETGEIVDVEREMTKAELDQLQKDQAEAQLLMETEAAKATEKAALLEKLGITADEAALLLS